LLEGEATIFVMSSGNPTPIPTVVTCSAERSTGIRADNSNRIRFDVPVEIYSCFDKDSADGDERSGASTVVGKYYNSFNENVSAVTTSVDGRNWYLRNGDTLVAHAFPYIYNADVSGTN
jgi:hypothetical protein